MTILEIVLSVIAACCSYGGIAYTLYVVRKTPRFDHPTDDEVRRMIDTAPRWKFDSALAR